MWKVENAMGITTIWYSEAEYNKLKQENKELKEKLNEAISFQEVLKGLTK